MQVKLYETLIFFQGNVEDVKLHKTEKEADDYFKKQTGLTLKALKEQEAADNMIHPAGSTILELKIDINGQAQTP